MTDIFDIKNNIVGFPLDLTLSLIYVFLFGLIVYLFFKIKKPKQVYVKVITPVKQIIKIDYYQKLINLEKSYHTIENNLFYQELSNIVRQELTNNGFDIAKLTLSEIKKLNIKNEIKNLLEEIYFLEFKNTYIKSENKLELINKVKSLIFNKIENGTN